MEADIIKSTEKRSSLINFIVVMWMMSYITNKLFVITLLNKAFLFKPNQRHLGTFHDMFSL